jgi:hypothetical protein
VAPVYSKERERERERDDAIDSGKGGKGTRKGLLGNKESDVLQSCLC